MSTWGKQAALCVWWWLRNGGELKLFEDLLSVIFSTSNLWFNTFRVKHSVSLETQGGVQECELIADQSVWVLRFRGRPHLFVFTSLLGNSLWVYFENIWFHLKQTQISHFNNVANTVSSVSNKYCFVENYLECTTPLFDHTGLFLSLLQLPAGNYFTDLLFFHPDFRSSTVP